MLRRNAAALKRKLSSRAGETLIEVLAALLISALAILMLSQAVASSVRLITKSEKVMGDYYAANNELATRAGRPDGYAHVTMTVDGMRLGDDLTVEYYVNDSAAGAAVVSYGLTD